MAISKNLEHIWSKLEVRVMIMVSLLLQIILIALGSRRKSTKVGWIMFLVWLSYLLADNAATLSLGFLIRSSVSDGGGFSPKYSSSNTAIMPLSIFWSPFILLHLGGPDTITAYSKQDNELWLRHLFSLIIQVVTVIYGLFNYWNFNNVLCILTVPIFISGLAKYGEKTWVLMSTSADPFLGPKILKDDFLPLSEKFISEADFLHIAYSYVKEFRALINGRPFNHSRRNLIQKMSANDAFKLVEVELSLMFDLLYTKTRAIYSTIGVLFRFIALLSTMSTLIIFCIMIDKHPYSSVDVIITLLLLVGAVALEVYAAFINTYSGWTMLWLRKQKKPCSDFAYRVISSCRLFPLCNKKRQHGSMGQLKLTSFRSSHSVLLKHVNYDKPFAFCFNLRTHWLMTQADVTDEIRERIFQRLVVYDVYEFSQRTNSKEIYSPEQWEDFGRYQINVAENLDLAILSWHVATQFIYDSDPKEEGLAACEASKLLANYMLYIQAACPFLLPKSVIRTRELGHAVQSKAGTEIQDLGRYIGERLWSEVMGQTLAKKAMWDMVCEVWVSILTYAAAKCKWEDQVEQLSKGGEFLSHVWLLMFHQCLAAESAEFKN